MNGTFNPPIADPESPRLAQREASPQKTKRMRGKALCTWHGDEKDRKLWGALRTVLSKFVQYLRATFADEEL